jgi:predicted nucleotidyltransferase
LFGSFARGDADLASDVDLVVEFDRPIGLRFMELCDYLEECLGREVEQEGYSSAYLGFY